MSLFGELQCSGLRMKTPTHMYKHMLVRHLTFIAYCAVIALLLFVEVDSMLTTIVPNTKL